jgi:hypothetical protein
MHYHPAEMNVHPGTMQNPPAETNVQPSSMQYPPAENVTELLNRLVAKGLLPTANADTKSIKPVYFEKPETLKV